MNTQASMTKQFFVFPIKPQFVDTTSDGNNFIFVASILSFVVSYFRHLCPPHKVDGVSDHEILDIPGRNSQGLQNVYKYISPLLLTISHSKTLGVLTRILEGVFASKLSQWRPNDLFMLKITESPVASGLNYKMDWVDDNIEKSRFHHGLIHWPQWSDQGPRF